MTRRCVLGFLGMVSASVLYMAACASGSASGPAVRKVSPADEGTLDQSWGAADAKSVAQEMSAALLSQSWLDEHIAQKGRVPVIKIRPLANKTEETIDGEIIFNIFKMNMMQSEKAGFVASGKDLAAIRAMQDDSLSGNLSDDTAPAIGNEVGADYVLRADISMAADGTKKAYVVSFTLTEIATAKIVWDRTQEIRK